MKDKFFSRGFEDYLKLVMFLSFSFLVLRLYISGDINYYISAKLIPLVLISCIFLIFIAIVVFVKTRTPRNSKNKISYVLFVIPLLMGYLVTPKVISQAEVQITGLKKEEIKNYYNSSKNMYETDEFSKNKEDTNRFSEIKEKKNELDLKPKKIFVEERNFSIMLDSLYMRMDEYTDVDIEIMGKVYMDESMENNKFAVVRPMMSCCSADASLVGLVCININSIEVKQDEWVKAEGKVVIIDGERGKMPAIKVEKVTDIEKPDNEFVYPY